MEYSLTILGSSSATPTNNRHHSSFILRFGQHKFMIDCGEGTQNRCLTYDINFQRIEIIFITHLHGDHILGLFGLINTMNLYSRKKKLTIFTIQGLKALLEMHFKTSEMQLRFELEIVELGHQEATILNEDDLVVKAFPVKHRVPCLAYRFEEKITEKNLNVEACVRLKIPVELYNGIKKGDNYVDSQGVVIPNVELTFDNKVPHVYTHITDTLYFKDIEKFAANADLLYHEATFLHNLEERAIETFHSTAQQAAQVAKSAKAHKLIIGHFSSRYKELDQHLMEAKNVFANSHLAIEGNTINLR